MSNLRPLSNPSDLRQQAEEMLSVLENLPTLEPRAQVLLLHSQNQEETPIVRGGGWVYRREDLRPLHMRQTGHYKMTTAMHREVISKLQQHQDTEVVRDFTIAVKTHDLRTLCVGAWLNDIVVDFYLQLITSRSRSETWSRQRREKAYAFSSHLLPAFRIRGHNGVESWTRNEFVFSNDLLLFPIHWDSHWTLVVVDTLYLTIAHYDSMDRGDSDSFAEQQFNDVLTYLAMEAAAKHTTFNVLEYTRHHHPYSPKQNNTLDCGVFLCKTAEFISRGAQLRYSQEEIPYYRQIMMWEICNKILLTP